MFIIINAMKSITRSKGRNILIGIIVLAIAASSCVALAIRNAAKEAETAGVDLVNITGSITVDREKLMEAARSGMSAAEGNRPDMSIMREMMSQYQNLSLSELLTYAKSDYVKDFYYYNSISLVASGDIEAYGTEESSGNNSPDGMSGQGRTEGMMSGIAMGDFTVTGYSSEDAMIKFINGTAKITDGKMFEITSSGLNCLISYELAAFNGLSTGDTITLANPNAENETYIFTITGIYTDSSSGDSGNQMRFSSAMDPANLICISSTALQAVMDNSKAVAAIKTDDYGNENNTAINEQLTATFVFTNKENYRNFNEELTAKGLLEYYTLTSSDVNSYESSLIPLKNLSDFAATLLFIILTIGAVILIVINIFNIRERKYEVGVLMAIGIKKGKVAMQFVTELLCVTLLAIIIGSGVGAMASIPVSNNLLSAQIEQTQSQTENQDMNFGRTGGRQNWQGGGPMMSIFGTDNQVDLNYLDQINATVSFSILGQLIGIGIILTLISSLAAVVFVMRYEPLKILANRT